MSGSGIAILAGTLAYAVLSRMGLKITTRQAKRSRPMTLDDVPPTGRPVWLAYIHVLRFRNGKHVSFNLMFDRLSMLEQLGLIPS